MGWEEVGVYRLLAGSCQFKMPEAANVREIVQEKKRGEITAKGLRT